MPIFIRCTILVLITMKSLLVMADEQVIDSTSNSTYIIFAEGDCTVEESDPKKSICTGKSRVNELIGGTLLPSRNLGVGFFKISASAEEDQLELLCYRCVLKKEIKSSCGRYSNVWGNQDHILKCPRTK